MLLALDRLPRSNQLSCPRHVSVVQQNQRFTSMPKFVLLVLARLLPDFCSKMTQFVPHGLEKAELGVGDRLISVILREQRLATLRAVFKSEIGIVKCLPDSCQTFARKSLLFVSHGSKTEPNARQLINPRVNG